MDIITQEDIYSPSLNDEKEWEDFFPPNQKGWAYKYPTGCVCPCNGTVYTVRSKFKSHTQSKMHTNWVNGFKTINYPLKLAELEKQVRVQKIIIQTLTNKLQAIAALNECMDDDRKILFRELIV